jgi:hypothetical protein
MMPKPVVIAAMDTMAGGAVDTAVIGTEGTMKTMTPMD